MDGTTQRGAVPPDDEAEEPFTGVAVGEAGEIEQVGAGGQQERIHIGRRHRREGSGETIGVDGCWCAH